ncbi:MAG: hypothetical protein FJ095_18720 [Deltaproteobacteria bacterium]|nr:hypothetical protein [Deltaproteobacteria bacterium]
MSRTPPRWLVGFVSVALGCRETPVTRDLDAKLESGVVAQIDSEIIRTREVSLVMREKPTSPSAARDALVHDSLFAAWARADFPEEAKHAEAAALSRALLHELTRQARESPISPDEFADWEQARFLDVDRPEGFRVVHAVALVDAKLPGSKLKEVRAYVSMLRERIGALAAAQRATKPPLRNGEDVFLERTEIPEDLIAAAVRDLVTGMSHGELDVRYEALGAISSDGRFLNYARSPWERLHETFAAAAGRLETRGDVSQLVETDLESDGKALRGLHVIVLLERTPAMRLPDDARRALLLPSILEARVLRARKNLLESLAKQETVVVERNADALLESVALNPNRDRR